MKTIILSLAIILSFFSYAGFFGIEGDPSNPEGLLINTAVNKSGSDFSFNTTRDAIAVDCDHNFTIDSSLLEQDVLNFLNENAGSGETVSFSIPRAALSQGTCNCGDNGCQLCGGHGLGNVCF